ncbi:hypothetical protein JCM3775_001761 [Rhodotorula graminis]
MADLVPHIYHETQEAGSMLCGQHALNNLLQSSLFTAPDLADIARQLDALEQAQLDPGVRLRGDEDGLGGSANYDDSGFFSVQVMEEALKVLGLSLVRWGSKEMVHVHNHPENMDGFLLNHQLHWFSVRRFGTADRFYNLDSCIPQPQWVSAMYLGLTLREAERQGYSIFAVVPSPDAGITGLPPCSAADLALSLPEPRGTDGFPSHHGNGNGASTSGARNGAQHTYFGGNGQSLAGAGSSSSSAAAGFAPSGSLGAVAGASSARKGKRPASTDPHRMDEDGGDDEDDVVIVEGPDGGSSASTSASGRRQRQRRRVGDGPLRDAAADGTAGLAGAGPGPGEEMSEEDMMAAAIAASLRVSSSAASDAGGSTGGGAGGGQQPSQSRAAQSEEDEFQRALQASLAEAGGAQGASEEPEEEDSPSLEELRRRRAARFG